MTGPFTVADLETLTEVVAGRWEAGADGDWSAPAGTLEWDCRRTAIHAADATLAPAFFLASRRTDTYPDGGWVLPDDASPEAMIDGIRTAGRVLAAVAAHTDPSTEAIIWRRPTVTVRPPSDFPARGAFELALHGHDVCAGLGLDLDPPRPVIGRLLDHSREWPHWSSPGWSPPVATDDPWHDLLRASGRQ